VKEKLKMAYDRTVHVKELDVELRDLLEAIEENEREIRARQDRLREDILVFRAKMAERDAINAAD
jgi:AmiR/NasT family two-component response regulator